MKVIIIGGGPAGMLAAIKSRKEKNQVTIIEKNKILGKKMLITGKGRCNITSGVDMSEFIKNVPSNGKFLYSSFKNFTNKDILKLLNIPVKLERGNRYFPVSDKAKDVVDALEKELSGVEIVTNTSAIEIITKNNEAIGVKTNKGDFFADKIILATGGKSYPLTGSTGDGYEMAKKLGHTITQIKPALVPLVAKKESKIQCQQMQGLSLRNVGLKLFNNNKLIYEDFGEMLFTHYGVTGPIILSASSHLVRQELKNPRIEIDLKPALTDEKLDERILRDFETEKNKEFRNSLDQLLPQKMIPVILEILQINKKVNEVKKVERQKLVRTLKHFSIEIEGFRDISEAIITSGGINVKEINPKTMESKLIKNLYFAGEIIDVDAYTGGFNLQIAYSTGYTAGIGVNSD
ncbi:MAG: NAD(P)/FAD-dependent oxidoreductase [Clostridiales bacterium]|jgi:flavoprotein family protein|nr:NAD(P)/FAD-dependent oxidoreductase [Clostridiales bacterium]